ncbi:MAG: hypothetical protein EA401_06575 [Planctomycetota bacterium]|nr:MAG: hypothetical protein EA401_06575 [Planctomycetota bacterium]
MNPRKTFSHSFSPLPLLVLPMEIYEREIDARLWLAQEAIKRGYQILIAHHASPCLRGLSDCGIFYKDHGPGLVKLRKYHGWIDPSLWVGALDEEGLVFSSEETYRKGRVNREALQLLDDVFFIGAWQEKVAAIEQIPVRTHVTGHPRFDLCHGKYQESQPVPHSQKIRVLVNTRFGSLFPISESLPSVLKRRTHPSNDINKENIANELVICREILDLVDVLSADPGVVVTLRPHPAEHMDYYRNRFSNVCNVAVERRAGVVHAIEHSDIVVHDGCTTAIEACLMGKPVIGLRPPLPYPAISYGDFCNRFSLAASSSHEARDIITCLRSADEHRALLRRMAEIRTAMWPSQFMSNWCMGNATGKILDVVDQQQLPTRTAPTLAIQHRWNLAREALRRFMLMGCSALVPAKTRSRPFAQALYQIHLNDSKFPKVTLNEMRERAVYIMGSEFVRNNIHLQCLARNCFLICPV